MITEEMLIESINNLGGKVVNNCLNCEYKNSDVCDPGVFCKKEANNFFKDKWAKELEDRWFTFKILKNRKTTNNIYNKWYDRIKNLFHIISENELTNLSEKISINPKIYNELPKFLKGKDPIIRAYKIGWVNLIRSNFKYYFEVPQELKTSTEIMSIRKEIYVHIKEKIKKLLKERNTFYGFDDLKKWIEEFRDEDFIISLIYREIRDQSGRQFMFQLFEKRVISPKNLFEAFDINNTANISYDYVINNLDKFNTNILLIS